MRSSRRVLLLSFVATAAIAAVAVACLGEDVTPGAALEADAATDSGSATTTDSGSDPAPPKPVDDGGTSVDAAPKTYCQTVVRPDAGDFFCADFDGADASTGFTAVSVPDGGTLKTISDLFYSPPNALLVRNKASLAWEISGPKTFKQIDARVRLNVGALGGVAPNTSGSIVLLQVSSVDSTVALRYTRGGNVEGSAYTGYYVRATTCPSACALSEKRLLGAPTTNAWTDVGLVWSAAGNVKVTFDDKTALDTSTVSSTSTKVGVKLGLEEDGSSPLVGQHAFDDLRVSVQRN